MIDKRRLDSIRKRCEEATELISELQDTGDDNGVAAFAGSSVADTKDLLSEIERLKAELGKRAT